MTGTGTVALNSGNDTSLKGAVVTGETVIANVGGDLAIESQQDASRYREKSTSVSGGISSSGIVAGAGGYHVAVGGGVDLKAGVIASSADKDKNALSADHLTYSNLNNVSNASSSGFGLSVGIGFDGKPSIPTPSVSQPAKEQDSGRALATLTPGALTLDNQKQDLSGLNTDLGKANTTVTPYDIDRLKAKQESAAALSELLNGLTGDISNQLHFAEGSPEKIALHTAVGAIVAKLAGGDIAAGAVAGAASEIANGVLQEVLKANPNLSEPDRKAITQWVAVLVGAAAGGETGAATAIDNVNHNYLDHYESLAREKAKQQLAQCQTKGGCSESDISALQKEVSYWDGIDEQRDDHLKSACDADPKGSACIAAVTDALKAIEYLRDPADPLKPSSILPGGYTDMAMRLQEDGRFGGLSNQELATAVYAERKQTIALLGNYGGSVQAALRDEARNGLINSAVAVLTFAVAEKVARKGGQNGSAGQSEVDGAEGTGSASNVALFERQRASYAAEEIKHAQPVGSALKDDPLHRAPSYVIDQIPEKGRVFTVRGGDGSSYNLTQMEGAVNGNSGVFEWMVNSKGELTHQRFIPGGRITGTPNQIPSRLP